MYLEEQERKRERRIIGKNSKRGFKDGRKASGGKYDKIETRGN